MSPKNSKGSSDRHRRKYSKDEWILLSRISQNTQPEIASDHALQNRLGVSAKESMGGVSNVRGCYRALKTLVRYGACFMAASLLMYFALMHYCGQKNITTAALLYLPQWIVILPILILAIPTLLIDWKSFILISLVSLLGLFSHSGFRIANINASEGLKGLATVRVMTWNRGQGKGASLQVIKKELHADFILLQDSVGKTSYYKTTPEYAEFSDVSGAGEFVMLSRWPILSVELIGKGNSKAGSFGLGRAARFVVLAAGARCAIYSVHLATPRDVLESYKRGAFLYGIIGLPGTPWEKKRAFYQSFWDGQIQEAAEIAERIRAETIPTLVCGDFNAPNFGPIYNYFASNLQDAHCEGGSGFGYTFPGDTNNPLALFQPWLRLDQMFASKHWEVRNCRTLEAKAQHLPVVADFHLLPEFRLVGGDRYNHPMAAPQTEPP